MIKGIIRTNNAFLILNISYLALTSIIPYTVTSQLLGQRAATPSASCSFFTLLLFAISLLQIVIFILSH